MGSAEVLDIESLINPISEEDPSGPELRRSEHAAIFHDLSGQFSHSVKAEKDHLQAQAFPDEEFPDLKDPEWEDVYKKSIEILATYSKDVSVASWMLEAAIRLDGVAGLRDGFKVMLEICRRYWDNIHPEPDEDYGYADTVSQLQGLASERSDLTLENLSITTGNGMYLSIRDFNEANRMEGMSHDHREQKLATGAVELRTFKDSFAATSRSRLTDIVDDLDQTLTTIRELESFLDERCVPNSYGEDTAPSMTSFRKKIESMKATIEQLMGELLDDEVDPSAAATNEGDGEAGAATTQKAVVGTIASRSDAIKMIRKIAEFFRKSEPQSFISFKLEQTASWAELPFPELLKELLRDDTAMGELSRRTGIPIPREESGEDGGGYSSY